MRSKLAALFLLVFLGSCAHIARIPDDYAVDPKSPNGLLITSLTFEGGLRFDSFTLEYRRVGGGDTERMHNASLLSAPDIQTDGRRGWLFPRELPPGEYEFYRWRGTSGNMTYWSPREFSHQFTLAAGRAVYIGSLNVFTLADRRYEVQVRDERERDVRAFLQRYLRVKRDQIAYEIMSVDRTRAARQPMRVDDFGQLLPGAAEQRRREQEQRRLDDLKNLLPGASR